MFLHIMLEYNITKILEKKNCFISFYKVGDWSILVETNVMYMHIQKTQIYSKNNLNDL
jgi:hypothetical protein